MSTERKPRPIVIVTGANGGVGFAVCQRLLLQLCQAVPRDSLPQKSILKHVNIDESADVDLSQITDGAANGLTLIMACRNQEKANTARLQLLQSLDAEILHLKKAKSKVSEKDVARATRFKDNLVVAVAKLDLASLHSVSSFASEIRRKYPHVSHIVCNAGIANFTGYNWPLAIKQLCTEFKTAVTRPAFKLQKMGQKSKDGLGLIMQNNVLSHYFLYRLLESLLKAYNSQSSIPSRVIWMSSLEADPESYDPNDWQLLQTAKPYDASKYQIDLLAGYLEREQQRAMSSGAEIPIRHFISHPGVVRTGIAIESLNNIALDYCMQLAFFIAHCLGSSAHVWTPYKAAVSAVHLMLVALPFITVATKNVPSRPHVLERTKRIDGENDDSETAPLKFGAEVDFCFNEYVGITRVEEWEKMNMHGAALIKRFDELFEQRMVEDS